MRVLLNDLGQIRDVSSFEDNGQFGFHAKLFNAHNCFFNAFWHGKEIALRMKLFLSL